MPVIIIIVKVIIKALPIVGYIKYFRRKFILDVWQDSESLTLFANDICFQLCNKKDILKNIY